MLRRRLIALLVLPLVVVLSSCMRLQTDYEILGDNKVRVAIDFGARNDVLGELGEDVPNFCEQDGLMNPKGLTKQEYSDADDDGYSGCRLTGTTTISELNESGTSLTLDDEGTWRFLMEGNDSMEGATMTPDMFSDFMIRIAFPGEVLTHNGASTVEGTTVTWSNPADLLSDEGLEATAQNTNTLPWVWIAAAVAGLVVGTGTVLALGRRRRTALSERVR